MWIVEWLLSILTYPITWFWTAYNTYKEERKVWKIIVLFVISLSGLFLVTYALLWSSVWLFTNHIEIVIIVGLLLWLYSYVKAKMEAKPVQEDIISTDVQALNEQANKAYPTVRNIMYQTLKVSAESIGGVIPRLLQELEVLEQHYIIANEICFYQFRLSKADIKVRYEQEELREFERILQNDISRKIQAGDFPSLGMEQFIDAYGNIYDAIYIDVIEDIDTCFIIQTVLYSPQYAEYLRRKRMNQQSLLIDTSVPDAKWDR